MKTPAFQFYPADFLSDENVVLMSNRELGCYIKLMCYCWREGSIPSDINKIGRLCNEDSSAMADLWLAIGSCFELAINDSTRLVHPRLERERLKQAEFKSERSSSGKKGAEARWGKGSSGNGSANGSAIKEPMAKDGFSSSSSSSSSSSKLPPKPPKQDRNRRGMDAGLSDALFQNFWAEYPRKVAKPEAHRAFGKLNVDDELLQHILDGLKRAKESRDWVKDDGQYIPHPSTWLNRKGWEDEYIPYAGSALAAKKNPEPVRRQARQVYQ